ncbi:hypothetical protein EJ110_NYTH39469 [Nymphaea thermarum]|nr:hypothetical protein EJ110_NYTH39469 [Nymphaea thermarum]
MEARNLLLALLLVLVSSSSAYPTSSLAFIKSSCSATRFPDLCLKTLSSYASDVQQNPRYLAQAALSTSLTRARSAADFFTKLSLHPIAPGASLSHREKGAIKDCISTLSDSVYQLGQSIDEVKHLSRSEYLFHVSNVQTWVSAALTDQNTCMDGFAGVGLRVSRVRALVRREIVGVAQMTSNALSLVNKLAPGHV